MRYSLVNRFRGALLGAFIREKEVFGSTCFSKAVIGGCESLIKLGRLDADSWLELKSNVFVKEQEISNQQVQCILATLPVALFFHENPIKLRHNLLDVVQIWSDDPILQDIALVFGYAIALSLQERFTPSSLIPQLVTFLGETSKEVPQQLLKVQELLLQRASLEQVKGEFRRENQLPDTIAIALYCLTSSLEDFRLSVLRSSQNGKVSPAVSIITGVLSGAYNSITGIPILWQAEKLSVQSSEITENSLRAIIELSDRLFAVWAGIYDFDSSANHDTIGKFAVVSARMVKWS
jgi:ADP-ribosylglycohydrolase